MNFFEYIEGSKKVEPRIKGIEDIKVYNKVFDIKTLKIIMKLISDGFFDILEFPISTGKEANVFRAVKSKTYYAVKIYRKTTAIFHNIGRYIIGDVRFTNIRSEDIIDIWAKKEFKNLEKLYYAKLKVPKPIICMSNVLVMEYIGSSTRAAPMLKDFLLKNPKKTFEKVLFFIKESYLRCNLVHADLSEYNVLVHKEQPVIIDLAQAVVTNHPESHDFFHRDIKNISNYFEKKYNLKSDYLKKYFKY